MLKTEGRMELAILRKHRASIRELARVAGHSRNMVRRYLRGGEAAERRRAASKRREKLDSFKDYRSADECDVTGPDPCGSSVPRDQGAGVSGRRDPSEAVRAHARAGARRRADRPI